MTFFKYGCGTPAGKLNGGPVTHDYRSGEKQMLDHNGRKIDYLRISVTDRCNLRCRYCMPDGICSVPMSQILTYEEIRTVAEAAAELGVRHIKLTGGEPLVRRGITHLIRELKEISAIESVTLTTNGTLLKKELPGLLEAGLDAVNISLDTMDREQYRDITGSDELENVLEAVRLAANVTGEAGEKNACRQSPFRVKINAVSLALGEENLRALISLAKDMPVDVRFIEMMPIGYGKQFPVRHPGNPCGNRKLMEEGGDTYAVISHYDLLRQLQLMYPGMREDYRQHGYGPAVYYTIPGFQGSIGLISAIHGKFCDSCNRVRLTSQGFFKTCLCYNEGKDLRSILRAQLPEKEMRQLLREQMQDAIYHKPDAHCFENPEKITERGSMHTIGG